MATYTQKQNAEASEKIVLAVIESSRRLMGWTVESGAVYKIENFDVASIVSVKDSGTAYNAGTSLFLSQSYYYYDRVNKIIYIRTSDDSTPNSKFIVVTFTNHYSNVPIGLPYDLSTGYEVFWEPMIESVSQFSVELDNNDQFGTAIEGSGSINFINDKNYWSTKYDNWTWENQRVFIYSTFDGLAATEAKLIFRGRIKGKKYSDKSVSFSLSDLLNELRSEFTLTNLADVAGARVPDSLSEAKARIIYGRLYGFLPAPIDQVVDGYPLTGTVTFSGGSPSVTGSGTSFLSEVAPGDKLVLNDNEVTIESVTSDTALALSEDYSGISGAGATAYIRPEYSKDYINRVFKLAGHALNQPATTVANTISSNRIQLTTAQDVEAGDYLYFGSLGSGEYKEVQTVNHNTNVVKLVTNLNNLPAIGSAVFRPPIKNVRIDDSIELQYERDYAVDATNATLTLTSDAELNVTPVKTLNGSVTFTSTLRTVSGSGTAFESQLRPGWYIRPKGQVTFYKILFISSDTSLTLTEASGYTDTDTLQVKEVNPYDPARNKFSCDIIGKQLSGVLAGTASDITKDILTDLGLGASLNSASFALSKEQSTHYLGIAIPEKMTDRKSPKARDIINKINISIFGSLVQNEDFELEYNILLPRREEARKILREFDVIDFSIDTNTDRIIKTAVVTYKEKEHDYLSGSTSYLTQESTSDIAQYLVQSTASKTIETYLSDEESARIFASRWSFLLEQGSSIVNIKTKMQASRLQINDLVEINHEKLYERIGGGTRKIAAIQKIDKSHSDVNLETEDLSNAFNRVGMITSNTAPSHANSDTDEKFLNGFITDTYGMIDNDADTFGLNLIW